MTTFKTAYGPKDRVQIKCGGGRTKQAHKDECDINLIVKQFHKTGVVNHAAKYEGNYGEFTAIDYHEAMNAVVAAEQMFMSLPAKIRARFQNDPGGFIDWATDPSNAEEMRTMGLMKPARTVVRGDLGAHPNSDPDDAVSQTRQQVSQSEQTPSTS